MHGEKRFKCSQCDYAVSLNNKLTEHLQNSHGEKKRSKCDICEGYILVVSLRNHKISCARKFDKVWILSVVHWSCPNKEKGK